MNDPRMFFEALKGAMQNPTPILQKMNLTPDAMKDPQGAVQQMLNSGQINQQQLQQAQQGVQMMMGNPLFKMIFGK